jgi:hypothetical protein
MNENPITAKRGSDLLSPPHVIPALMELFAGDRQLALAQQEQMFTHLVVCEYCRTAAMFLLGVAQAYDERNHDPGAVAHELLLRFAALDGKIEAHRYERLSVYAETIVAEGREKAAALFPALSAHLKACSDCRAMVDETVAFISEAERAGRK